jgi:flagellar biosynthetic protein FliS
VVVSEKSRRKAMTSNAATKLPEPESRMTTAEVAAALHERAIEQLADAIEAIAAGQIERRCHAINDTAEIVATLHVALEFDPDNEIVDRMGALYRFVLASLFRVNLQNDHTLAVKLIEVLRPLAEAWRLLAKTCAETDATTLDTAMIVELERASRSAEAASL